MRRTEHFLLLIWLFTTGLVAFAFFILTDQGLMGYLVHTDRSYVSIVVILMYVFGLVHSLRRTWYLSVELNRTAALERMLGDHPGAPIRPAGDDLICAGVLLPGGFVHRYVTDLVKTGITSRPVSEAGEEGADLLDAHAIKWRAEAEFGWFLIDLILKVGFLGTLVGFIWMLASVSQHPVVDASSMQTILREMSFGMSTALNTTLSSLVVGILLSLPYYALGRGLEELLETTLRLSRTEILPRLAPATA